MAKKKKTSSELVHPSAEGFSDRVTPKEAGSDVFFFECKRVKRRKECGGKHFRHAGYMKTMVPFMRTGGEKRINVENQAVHVCLKCQSCYVWINEQMYDVTEHIDLKAWEKFEKKAHKATGPGGEC